MSRSLIQTVNQSIQSVTEGSIISLGSVLRRYGCNCRLNGNAIEIEGCGYYEIDCAVTVAPTEAGIVTVTLLKDGVPITGAIASGSVTTATNPVTLPIITTVRLGCACEGASGITCELTEGTGTVQNVSVRVVKS